MGPDLSHSTSSPRFPRILIAENHLSTVESLIQIFGDRRLDFDYEVCTSHRGAVRKLLASPYQLIISGVHLAEIDDFLLLNRTQALEAFVPVVISAATGEKESARRVLEQGAFDLIPTPFEHEQTVSTIRLALWHNKFNALIASRDKAQERYRHHIADYPGNRSGEAFQTILTSIEQSVAAHERTLHQIETSIKRFEDLEIETSLKRFADLAKTVENQAREGALARLDSLYGPPR